MKINIEITRSHLRFDGSFLKDGMNPFFFTRDFIEIPSGRRHNDVYLSREEVKNGLVESDNLEVMPCVE